MMTIRNRDNVVIVTAQKAVGLVLNRTDAPMTTVFCVNKINLFGQHQS